MDLHCAALVCWLWLCRSPCSALHVNDRCRPSFFVCLLRCHAHTLPARQSMLSVCSSSRGCSGC